MPKAYVYTAHGGPEVEAFIDLPTPEPGPGQLAIAVRAAGVNPVDWKLRDGLTLPGLPAPVFPVVLGVEAAGVVTGVGPEVTGFAVGDEVLGGTVGGAYAEYALLAVALATHKPAAVSFRDAAALPVAAATAYDGVHQLALPAGATLLITGVGGGVGVAAAQIARHAGLTVVGTASAGKKDLVESLGVAWVEPGPGVVERVRAVAPQGVDAVYDLVGGAALEEIAGVLAPAGGDVAADAAPRLITAADTETVTRLGGVAVQRARNADVLDAVAGLVAAGVLDPHISDVYPLDRAGAALREVETGHARGKIVIEVAA
ncbi:NADP-dependent oxidoreductase [Frankia sp. QA3]|uniref:NADP-dependent oxidoreductase n=1 Tax=Frankia sp. QA3 TaxID=710111 RepID=UPI000269B84E|nr:NADP-dependent oxidoreductase [Frankia sp. QA3]EIV90708.1 Zn-dependent oxidoreductase, NADPH:quinone reductase [Frankia sp. QA3]